MGLYVIFGALAAFGLFCVLWTIFGNLLLGRPSLAGLCRCTSIKDGLEAVGRWRWLRNAGLVSGILVLVDYGLTPAEREYLQSIGSWIQIWDGEILSPELERNKRG